MAFLAKNSTTFLELIMTITFGIVNCYALYDESPRVTRTELH